MTFSFHFLKNFLCGKRLNALPNILLLPASKSHTKGYEGFIVLSETDNPN